MSLKAPFRIVHTLWFGMFVENFRADLCPPSNPYPPWAWSSMRPEINPPIPLFVTLFCWRAKSFGTNIIINLKVNPSETMDAEALLWYC